MTFPNPAGYYLPLPEEISTKIESLDFNSLAILLSEFADYFAYEVNDGKEAYLTTSALSNADDQHLMPLNKSQAIALIRWISERLAWLESQEKAKDGQS